MPVERTYTAFNTQTQQGQPGDAAQHTLFIKAGNADPVPLQTPPVELPVGTGEYEATVLPDENPPGEAMTLLGVSATPGVIIIPTRWDNPRTAGGDIYPPPPGTADAYSSPAAMRARYGNTRIRDLVPPEANEDTYLAEALARAAREIDMLLQARYAVPVNGADAAAHGMLAEWNEALAAEWAWRHRGNYDADGNNLPDGPFTADANSARRDLRLVAARIRTLPGAAFRTVPV